MVFKVAIVGYRNFYNSAYFKIAVDGVLSKFDKNKLKDIVIISGGCRGTDKLAVDYAVDNGYEYEIYCADWLKYGKGAGPKRNDKIVDEADFIIAFLSGFSKGTKDVIMKAHKKEIMCEVIKV